MRSDSYSLVGTLVGRDGWLAAQLRAARGMIAAWRTRHRERRTLLQLNDRLLRDIGLTRTDVIHGTEAVLARVTARHG